jgi:hypothetical protein
MAMANSSTVGEIIPTEIERCQYQKPDHCLDLLDKSAWNEMSVNRLRPAKNEFDWNMVFQDPTHSAPVTELGSTTRIQ